MVLVLDFLDYLIVHRECVAHDSDEHVQQVDHKYERGDVVDHEKVNLLSLFPDSERIIRDRVTKDHAPDV